MSLVVNLIGQQSRDVIGRLSVSRDVIGCEDCKKRLVHFNPSFVSQKSVGLLLVKLPVSLMLSISAGSCRQQLSGIVLSICYIFAIEATIHTKSELFRPSQDTQNACTVAK